jgi:hypothetical protein
LVISISYFLRKLAVLDAGQMLQIEAALKKWLGL